MPFGISSAPEVFQRKMHELIEGMTDIEVVADDFIAVGYGETFGEATQDHDKNLLEMMRSEEHPSKSGEANIATVASAVHRAHGNRQGTRSRPCQSSSYQ